MIDCTADELQAAIRPIASLLSKSEKSQQRMAAGTWQHKMLEENIRALRIASSLMLADSPIAYSEAELKAGLTAVAAMIERSRQAEAKFSPGTSQHTLLRNRIKALVLAESFINASLACATA